MSIRGNFSRRAGLLGAMVVVGALLLSMRVAMGQDTAGGTAAKSGDAEVAAPATDSAKTPAVTEQPAATPQVEPGDALNETKPAPEFEPAANAVQSEKAKSEESAATPPVVAKPPSGPTSATGQPAPSQTSSGINSFLLGLVIIALFVLPVLAGNYLAKLWKMPDYAWKFSVVIGVFAAAVLIILFGEFKFGPDLAGGITLIYEVENTGPAMIPDADGKSPATAPGNGGGQTHKSDAALKMSDLIAALKQRVDPTGTREVTIREYGHAVEIIIPQQGREELEYIKRRATDVGQLEFRITADPNFQQDRPIIEQAKLAPPAQKDIYLGGKRVAEWVAYQPEEFGPIDRPDSRIVKRMAGDVPEALVLIDPLNVTGDYLTSVTKGIDQAGHSAVNFTFDRRGSAGFRLLTSQNKPTPSGAQRYLGIILDKRLTSAPGIRETISDHGQISGGAMTDKEVDYTISILKQGPLPASLNKIPISQTVISPTLGAVTIQKAKQAIFWSMVAVVAFMLVYYRVAGVVACLALTFNLLLVLALMVLIKGAFTLPGLAGLVLTIGMSVDANILIYERIREELESGAALRMAIRNGFSRAMTAIIDSNVTTIISGVALYAIGTDQVKGFAVTLILGILTSMFTAIFFSRIVLDVAERRGWIKQLSMMRLMARPNYDFLGKRWWAIGGSMILTAIGMIAVVGRGSQLFDIDFTGGTSVTFTLKEADKMPISEVRDTLLDSELKDKNLLVVERGDSRTRYSIDSSLQEVAKVEEILKQKFGEKLMTSAAEVKDLKPFAEGDFSGTEAKVLVNAAPEYTQDSGISYDALRERLRNALAATGHSTAQPILSNPGYHTGSAARFKEWNVRLTGLNAQEAQAVFERVQADLHGSPLFPMANTIGGRVSRDMQSKAFYAVAISLTGAMIYLWLRFQKAQFGLAAAIAVFHDVAMTVGLLALSAYVVEWFPNFAEALQIDAFQINLTIVAALLTIIGYSLHDTIVTFDRLREIRGKSPHITAKMVNDSVNQCLSRTILTVLTVFLTVVILYFFGGEGIHSFAFAFIVGVITGTFSSVYIAAPLLLWLSGESAAYEHSENQPAVQAAGMGRAG